MDGVGRAAPRVGVALVAETGAPKAGSPMRAALELTARLGDTRSRLAAWRFQIPVVFHVNEGLPQTAVVECLVWFAPWWLKVVAVPCCLVLVWLGGLGLTDPGRSVLRVKNSGEVPIRPLRPRLMPFACLARFDAVLFLVKWPFLPCWFLVGIRNVYRKRAGTDCQLWFALMWPFEKVLYLGRDSEKECEITPRPTPLPRRRRPKVFALSLRTAARWAFLVASGTCGLVGTAGCLGFLFWL